MKGHPGNKLSTKAEMPRYSLLEKESPQVSSTSVGPDKPLMEEGEVINEDKLENISRENSITTNQDDSPDYWDKNYTVDEQNYIN